MAGPKKNDHPSKKIFEVIANEAIMGIMAFSTVSRECSYINRLAKEVLELGLTEGEEEGTIAVKITLEDLIPEGENTGPMARPLSKEMFESEGLFQDVTVRKQNGLIFIANVGVKHISLDDGTKLCLLMFQDTTIQKRLQREVQAKQEQIHRTFTEILEQNRQLKELDSAKDRFIALTTHELRTPLSAILATADVLVNHFYESTEQKEEFIKTVHEQANHLMQLVNDILDFAKIRAGKMELFIEQVEVMPILSAVARNFEQMAAQNKITVEIESVESDVKVYADVMRLREVLDNVINNAIKYNRAGGVVRIAISQGPEFVRVSVCDTGIGIPEARLPQVFNEFETVGRVNHHAKGTGLGMPIAKRLMEAIGGKITLESVEDVGTTFFVDIPVTKVLAEDLYRSRTDSNIDLAA